MVIKARSAVVIAMIWLATVAGVSATAWFAIDRAGRDLAGAGVSPLPAVSAGTAVATPAPGGSPSRTKQAAQGSTSTTPSRSANPRDRTVQVAGGQVSIRCTGTTILLRIAQPDNGWRVEVNSSGPQNVDLNFRGGADDNGPETQVRAACASGTPAFSVGTDS